LIHGLIIRNLIYFVGRVPVKFLQKQLLPVALPPSLLLHVFLPKSVLKSLPGKHCKALSS
jgi:hypothetical protein